MTKNFLEQAREVIRIEAESVAALCDRLDENFSRAVEAILKCKGRVIVAGMGKSGLIGQKIAATFNSTGIPSFFLHPAEALHGDLGVITPDDILFIISKSGQLGETEFMISAARRLRIPIIVLCGAVDSELFKKADIAIDCSVEQEACPNNLVPTSSSTAALAMGDALAMVLLKARNFSTEDFAALHPGGVLGRRLLKHVSEVHRTGNEIPLVERNASMKEMIFEMTSKRLGCVVMKNQNGSVAGIFTDGDFRRLAEDTVNIFESKAEDVMIKNPKTISDSSVLDAALALMEQYSITQLPTVDAQGRLSGVLHLHDILKSKLV